MSNSINAVQECIVENRQLRSEMEAIKQELASKDRLLDSKQSQMEAIEDQLSKLWEALRIEKETKYPKSGRVFHPKSLKAQYEMLQKNIMMGV